MNIINLIFFCEKNQTERGWNQIKYMIMNLEAENQFVLPNWAEFVYVGKLRT